MSVADGEAEYLEEPRRLVWPLGALAAWLEAERACWFNWVPVILALGVSGYFWLPVEPGLGAALLPVPAALVLKVFWRRHTLTYVLAGVLMWLSLGFGIAKLRTEWVRGPVLERQLTGVAVRGFAVLVEPKPTKGQRITLRVTSLVTSQGAMALDKVPRLVRVRTMKDLPGLRPGDPVALTATLGPPGEPSLPGGFDFGRQAWYLGIGGVGYAMAAARIDPDAGPLPWQMWATASIERARVSIGRAVVAALPGETGGIANALITGERGGITAATDAAYRDSGLYHILSISGLHMVVMAGAVFFSVRLVLAAIPGIALRYRIKTWAAAAAALGALGYLLISGGSFATVRSYVQISILFFAMMAERPALALRNVALAALGLLLLWPESLFDAGFQMSFAAVVALISGFEAVRAREERLGRVDRQRGPVMGCVLFIGGIMGSTVVVTAAVAPIAAYHFHTSQQYGMIANLVALPICDVIVMPLALATLVLMPFGLEAAPLWLAGWGIDAMTGIAYAVARLPGAAIPVAAIPLAAFLWMLAGGLWLLLWETRWRLLGAPLVLAGLVQAPFLERPDIIVGRDGKLVAARADGVRFSALPAPRSLYELSRWLEADGDGRKAKSVATGDGFGCDGTGCAVSIKGQRLAVTRHAGALAEDCARASILVLNMPRPKGCLRPGVVIDPDGLRRGGVHTVYVSKDGVRLETVGALRGDRPWSRPPPQPKFEPGSLRPPRLTQFAIQAALALGQDVPRPENEGEDAEADGGRPIAGGVEVDD